MTIQQFKSNAIKTLSETSPSAALDVSIFLQHCLGRDKTWVLMNQNSELSDEELAWLKDAVEKRSTGLPVAYITGHKEFYGYNFAVSPDVLIPKPDTEILVEKAIDVIIEKMEARPEIVLSVCDMCTGSGCIGISVLKQLIEEYKIPSGSLPKFTMVDISPAALEIARKNATRLLPPEEAEEIRFIQSNLFSEIDYTFDVILTNPPYIPAAMVDELLTDGRSEPRLALDGDTYISTEETLKLETDGDFSAVQKSSDGLKIIRSLWPECAARLVHNGVVLMETGEYNAKKAAELAEEQGFRCIKIIPDLEGQDRDIYAVK